MKRTLLLFVITSFAGGCGIQPQSGPTLDTNATLPISKLTNDVYDADSDRFILDAYCGHLVEQLQDGSFRSLFIAAYPAGAAPTLVTPAQASQQDYHSLMDKGGSAQLSAAYGPGSAAVDLTGEDRLEVTVNTLAFCRATNADKDAISKAVKQLDALKVDRDKIWLVGTATYRQMTVDLLHAISTDAKGAVTPIVNFGGQNYSKISSNKATNYVSLDAVPVNTAYSAPAGDVVSTAPVPTPPVQPQPSGPASPPALPAAAVPPPPLPAPPIAAAVPVTKTTLPTEEFTKAVGAAAADKSIVITKGTK
jgi:hypothetical protein